MEFSRGLQSSSLCTGCAWILRHWGMYLRQLTVSSEGGILNLWRNILAFAALTKPTSLHHTPTNLNKYIVSSSSPLVQLPPAHPILCRGLVLQTGRFPCVSLWENLTASFQHTPPIYSLHKICFTPTHWHSNLVWPTTVVVFAYSHQCDYS